MTEVTPHPECPFTPKTFELLEKFKNSSSEDFYLTHEKEFQEYLEQALQKIYKYLIFQLQGEMTKKLNIKNNELPETTKNGCKYNLYHQSSSNKNDTHLFINIVHTEFRFGLFIPEISNEKARFIKSTQNNRIKEIILQNTNILDDCEFHYSSDRKIKKINFLADWLRLIARQNSKTKNIQVSTHLESNKVLLFSFEELVVKIKQTLECVYILFITATSDNPVREINVYLSFESNNISIKYCEQGLKYYNQKDFQQAVKQYDLALKENPNFTDAYRLRAKAKEKLGDKDGAISDFHQLLLIQPNNTEVYNSLGDLYFKREDYFEAIQNYSQIILINANSPLAYYRRVCTYLKLEQLGLLAFKTDYLGFYNKEIAIKDLHIATNLFEKEKDIKNYTKVQNLLNTIHPDYSEPEFTVIYQNICFKKLKISENLLRRYHLALKTRKFVILSGISGTGKTWLTKAYAEAIGAKYLLVPVAPNWTTNEDLLGYFNPIDKDYHHTEFSHFLEQATEEYEKAKADKHTPIPYHLVLDEMNLARVEYYFAKFLSVMEVRMREEETEIELAPGKKVLLPPNLYFIGTVNVDETTHNFADKIYDRAQMIELEINRDDLKNYLVDVEYQEILMQIWDSLHEVAPFAFRTLSEIKAYVTEAEVLDISWNDALDEQLLQKILPKLKGADERIGEALKAFIEIAKENKFNLSLAKATKMRATFEQHGFTSYF